MGARQRGGSTRTGRTSPTRRPTRTPSGWPKVRRRVADRRTRPPGSVDRGEHLRRRLAALQRLLPRLHPHQGRAGHPLVHRGAGRTAEPAGHRHRAAARRQRLEDAVAVGPRGRDAAEQRRAGPRAGQGLPDRPGRRRRHASPDGGFAQLVWTLNQLGVGGVEVYIDGQRSAARRSTGPLGSGSATGAASTRTGLPAIDAGATSSGRRRLDHRGRSVAGPAGRPALRRDRRWRSRPTERSHRRRPARPRQRRRDALRRQHGRSLRTRLNGRIAEPRRPGPRRSTRCGPCATAREVVLVPAGGVATSVSRRPSTSDRPGRARCDCPGTARGSRWSPVEPGRERLYIGVVIRDNNGSVPDRAAAAAGRRRGGRRGRELARRAHLGRPGPGRCAGQRALHRGRRRREQGPAVSSRSRLPGPPEAVAAAATLPLLTVAGGAIWRTPVIDDRWSPLGGRSGADSAPAYPG